MTAVVIDGLEISLNRPSSVTDSVFGEGFRRAFLDLFTFAGEPGAANFRFDGFPMCPTSLRSEWTWWFGIWLD